MGSALESKIIASAENKQKTPVDISIRLIEAFKILRKYNIDTLGVFLDSIKDMDEKGLWRLDRELCLWYSFLFLHHCGQATNDKNIAIEAAKAFYEYLDGEVLDKNLLKVSVQDKIMIRFKPYSEALNKSDPTWYLSKELGRIILGEEYKSIENMISLGNYVDYISKQISDIVSRVLESY